MCNINEILVLIDVFCCDFRLSLIFKNIWKICDFSDFIIRNLFPLQTPLFMMRAISDIVSSLVLLTNQWPPRKPPPSHRLKPIWEILYPFPCTPGVTFLNNRCWTLILIWQINFGDFFSLLMYRCTVFTDFTKIHEI